MAFPRARKLSSTRRAPGKISWEDSDEDYSSSYSDEEQGEPPRSPPLSPLSGSAKGKNEPFDGDDEPEAESYVTSEEDEYEDEEELISRPAKRSKTKTDRFPDADEIPFPNRGRAFPAPPPRRKRGKTKKRDESSVNKEWLKWEEESKKELNSWTNHDDTKEYEELRRKKAACMERHETPPEFVFPLLPFQAEFLSWGLKQELSVYKGGILADEMGMGKTIQALSLVLGGRAAAHGHEEPSVIEAEKNSPEPEFPVENINATLVVCPVVAIEQWRSEIERFTSEGALKVLVYHGNSRKKLELEDLAEYDIILSTYSTIEYDYRKMLPDKLKCKYCKKAYTKQGYARHLKFFCGPFAVKDALKKKSSSKKSKGETSKKKGLKRKKPVSQETLDQACKEAERVSLEGYSLLHSVKWVRVILDEAHTIKERSSNTAKAVFALETCYRWLLSGTPLQNRVGELYSLVRFLRLDPFSHFFCTKCDCKVLDYPNLTCDKCDHAASCHLSWWNKFVSNPIKLSGFRDSGERSMKLLRRKILDEVLLRRTKTERAADLVIPPKTVLVRKDTLDEEEEDFYESVYKQSKSEFNTFVAEGTVLQNYASIFDLLTRLRQAVDHPYLITASASLGKRAFCGICYDYCDDPEVAECGDAFCEACLKKAVEEHKSCSKCYRVLALATKARPAAAPVESKILGFKKGSIITRLNPVNGFRTSTKIEALREEIFKMIAGDASAKALVFSQFTSMLDLIRYSFDLAGIRCVHMDGSMALGQRVKMIDAFRNDPECKVFLMSLKAGGVALNLTVASHIFIMDPWWNPAVEHQAQDRIHRIGQCKPIRVTRFIIEKSVEERILELQTKKQLVFEGTVGGSTEAFGKLTEKDFRFLFST